MSVDDYTSGDDDMYGNDNVTGDDDMTGDDLSGGDTSGARARVTSASVESIPLAHTQIKFAPRGTGIHLLNLLESPLSEEEKIFIHEAYVTSKIKQQKMDESWHGSVKRAQSNLPFTKEDLACLFSIPLGEAEEGENSAMDQSQVNAVLEEFDCRMGNEEGAEEDQDEEKEDKDLTEEDLQDYVDFLQKRMQPLSKEFLKKEGFQSKMEEVDRARKEASEWRNQKGRLPQPKQGPDAEKSNRLNYGIGLKESTFRKAKDAWLQYLTYCQQEKQDPVQFQVSVLDYLEYLCSPASNLRHQNPSLRVRPFRITTVHSKAVNILIAAKMYGYMPLQESGVKFLWKNYWQTMEIRLPTWGELRATYK